MNIQRSVPIPIRNGRKPYAHFDTPPNLASSGSLSPNLSAPSPPNFVPREPDAISKVGRYLLLNETQLNVYKALDSVTQDELVCKVVEVGKYLETFAANFSMEPHDNVKQVQEVLLGDAQAYAFFPASHGDMHMYARSQRKLNESEASRLFRQMVSAIAHCHRHGIVLRDLKLRKFAFQDFEKSHVVLESLEDASILSSEDDSLCDKHGCPAYVSPEILNPSSSYSGKCADIWSLGAILYTMLAGRYPFHDKDPSVLFGKIRCGKFNVPDSVSPQAKCLIRSLMRVDPTERLTADEILEHPWLNNFTHNKHMPMRSGKVVDDQLVPDMGIADDDDSFFS
ncbi:tribbles homolog 2-like [Amphiura filiformis]|uniref:tribbles homolog 2-like n=1 Tax=Amphiura filiformis TaxID=82378 RepID=UPI003B221510